MNMPDRGEKCNKRVLFYVTCILILNLVTTMNIRLQKRYTEKDICDETKETVHEVKACPVDIATFNNRSNEKNCEGKCMGQKLVYHCVMFEETFVEVCAPRTYITGQCCALYNKQLGRVIEDFRRLCPACPDQYLSDDYETASLCVDHYCGEDGNRHKRDCMGGVPVKAPESSTQVVTNSTHEWHNKEPNNDDQWNFKMFIIIIIICVFVLLLAMVIAYFQRKRMTMELKRQGQANIDHHPPLSDADLIKMYDYLSSSDSAQVLQHNVFVNIMMHFGRRVRENLKTLRKADFLLVLTERDVYMWRTFEINKQRIMKMTAANQRAECMKKEIVTAVPKDNIHFNNVVLGHNKMGNMMNVNSKAASLSRRYTNHSLRVTTVHILDEKRVPSSHIMSVTGHKSESSLKTYSGRTTKSTKRLMSESLSARSGVVSSNSKSKASSTIT